MSFVSESANLVRAFLEADKIAEGAEHPLLTAHVLLALFTFPNRAMQLLSERDIDQDQILDAFREVEDEPSKMVKRPKLSRNST